MITHILLNMISTTMLLMVVWTTINFFQLDKKIELVKTVQQMLNGFFLPLLKWIKGKLPASQLDYSPLVFIIALWVMYRILLAIGQ